jgi:carbon storage regulator
MLVLSRQRDETIIIGDNIEITVVDIRGDKVRLGVSAPKEISVHRKEVYDAIKRENREASHAEAAASATMTIYEVSLKSLKAELIREIEADRYLQAKPLLEQLIMKLKRTA